MSGQNVFSSVQPVEMQATLSGLAVQNKLHLLVQLSHVFAHSRPFDARGACGGGTAASRKTPTRPPPACRRPRHVRLTGRPAASRFGAADAGAHAGRPAPPLGAAPLGARPALALEGGAAGDRHNGVHDEQHQRARGRQQPRVLPPQAAPQHARLAVERKALALQVVRLVHQQLDALAAVQHLPRRARAAWLLAPVRLERGSALTLWGACMLPC